MTTQRGDLRLSASFIVAMVSVLAATRPAHAEMPGDVADRIRFTIGGMATNTYTDAGLGSVNAGIGASINFEDIFDLPENKDVWRGEINWRITKRNFIDLGYFE